MTERRSEVRAVLRTVLAVAAVVLLTHGITQHDGHPGSAPLGLAGPLAPATQAPPITPVPAPGDAGHDGCPKPWEHPYAAGWVKSPGPPSRNGVHRSPRRGPASSRLRVDSGDAGFIHFDI